MTYRTFARTLLILVTASWLFATLPGRGQETDALSLQVYKQQLEAAIEQIDGGEVGKLAKVRRDLERTNQVEFPGGEIVPVSPLLQGVKDRQVALDRLRVVVDQIERSVNDRTVERLAILDSILARRSPEQVANNWLADLWQRFLRWLERLLRDALPDVAPNPEASAALGTTTSWVIVIVGGVVIALLLGFWLQGFLRNFVRDRSLRQSDEDGMPASAEEARKNAAEMARAGNFREAVRQMYLASLLSLEESGLIHYDRTLTNHEVLEQINDNRPLRNHMQPVVTTFDDVWYGIREPDSTTFDGYVREIDELESIVKREKVAK